MMKKVINSYWKIIVVILIFVVLFFIINNKKNNLVKVINNNSISQTKTTDWLGRTYDPENTGKEFDSASEKTLTSTGWKKPQESYTISSGNSDLKVILKDDYVIPSSHNNTLDLFDLSSTQMQHIIDYNYTFRSIVHYDVTGDGEKETIITSVGLGCGTCVDFYISVFTDKEVFVMRVNEGAIVPRQDGNGFYLANYYWGGVPSLNKNSRLEISKYSFEQNQFKEIARKTVTLIAKDKVVLSKMKTYDNYRYSFSIEYPAVWHEGNRAANGDGIVLHEDEANDIRVYGSNIPSPFSQQNYSCERSIFLLKMGNVATKLVCSLDNKISYTVFFTNEKEVQYLFNATLSQDFYTKNRVILDTVARSLTLNTETPTVTKTLTKYTLIESHRGIPRLVSMQEGKNLLASNEYYDILKQRIEKDNLSAKIWIESKCNEFWIFDKPNDEFVSVERHGYHSDGCPGDPNFAPRLDVFNINRETKEIFWLDIGNNKNIPYKDWAKTISKE